MKKAQVTIFVILAILIVGFILFYVLTSNKNSQNLPEQNQNNQKTNQANEIKIVDFSFSPAVLNIKSGEKVSWTNEDSAPHTIVSESGGEMNSERLSKNGVYQHTFSNPGAYSYICGIHPDMKGKIVVE